MTRRRWVIALLALVAVQLAAIGIYYAVEARREQPVLGVAPPRPAHGSVSTFEVRTRADETRELVGGPRPVLVHFWATWCPPCLVELPLVLTLADDLPFEVVAVALDDDWSAVDTFLAERRSPRVVLADRSLAEARFDISSLPQTVLMAPDGTLLLRANGARDWQNPEFLQSWSSDRQPRRD